MTKVGADKRLGYYQLASDEVITELRSHPYGLTTPEAKRRLEQNGINIIRAAEPRNKRLHPVVQPWLLGLLAVGIASAWYTDEQWLAATLTLMALLSILSDAWREHSRDTLEYNIHQLLPARATIRRSDMAQVIDTTELVVGDIIELEAGMQLPADVRILQTDKLLIDDSVIFAHGSNYKFAHAIDGVLPLAQRHNLAFTGTSVLSGSGKAIVTATGTQTELGRILVQANATQPKSSLFHSNFYRITQRFAWIAIGLLVILGIVVAATALEIKDGATYGLAIAISLLPVGASLAMIRMFATFSRRARAQGLTTGSNSVADRLGSIDTLLLDEADIIVERTAVATEFVVGRSQYRSTGTQLAPNGELLTQAGKPITKKTLNELEFFFHALALSTQARLLPPDESHTKWHSAGPAAEGALVALAAQAGVNADELRQKHPQLGHHTYDYSRQLASTIHRYGSRQIVFVHGATHTVTARATHVWEAGHTRKITAADRAKFEKYHLTQTSIGNHVVAVAYQQLSKNIDVTSLDAASAEKDLIILGLVSVGQPIKHVAILALQAAQAAGIKTSFISGRSATATSGALLQLGIPNANPVSGQDLLQLDDDQILQLLAAGDTVFTHLAPEQRLRLIDIAERNGRHAAVSGSGLADIPALRHATIALCTADANPTLSGEVDIVLSSGNLHSFTNALGQSREISAHIRGVIRGTIADHSIQLWLVLISLGFYLSDRIPLATTATLLLMATLLHSVALTTFGQNAATRHESPSSPPRSSIVDVGFGLLGGLLICMNFVYFFIRTDQASNYIDSSSNLYLQAATLGFVTLVLCMWANLFFAQADHTPHLFRQQLRNKTLLLVFGLTMATILAAVYSETIQKIVGTRALTIVDWLYALFAALIYFAIRMLSYTEHRRVRGTVAARQL
ncbi:cation-translocating P-type ATPase [soil metagenome]